MTIKRNLDDLEALREANIAAQADRRKPMSIAHMACQDVMFAGKKMATVAEMARAVYSTANGDTNMYAMAASAYEASAKAKEAYELAKLLVPMAEHASGLADAAFAFAKGICDKGQIV